MWGGRLGKLVRFAAREWGLVRARRSQLGLRRAVAERVRVTLELPDGDELSRHRAALEVQAQAVAPIPDMGRALEGLAARIDALDAAMAAVPSSPSPPAPPKSGIALPPRRARRPPEFVIREDRLRVLGVTDMYPLISETYIGEELGSLVAHGVDLAWYRRMPGPAQMAVAEPVYDDFEAALEAVRPHVALIYWLTTADFLLGLMERHDQPFALRAHSFDFDAELMSRLLSHPLCVGGWTYPGEGFAVPGAHTLAPIFASQSLLPAPAPQRDLVISASAGLPKKDWPLLLDAFDQIEVGDRRLIVGVTVDHEDNPTELLRAGVGLANPPLVQVNLTRAEVLGLLSRTAASIYTLREGARFGMPMSIVDALCAGCSVIVPDRPEAVAFAGPDARPYRTAADIARHASEVLAGGPAVREEQERNRRYGLARFADPAASARFAAELWTGLERVQPDGLPAATAQPRV